MKPLSQLLIVFGLLSIVGCNQNTISSETKKFESVPIQPKNQQNLSGRRNCRDVQNQNFDKQNVSRNSSQINYPRFSKNCIVNNNHFNFNLPNRGAPEERGEGADSADINI
jgi:hypothetical protein